MSQSPFKLSFDRLPATLPVFPLTGAVIMPGNELALNIFEPRYLNMVSDVLGSHHMIGMIQPDPEDGDDTALCRTGCAGRITRYSETDDGRIEMLLRGVCRFDICEELPTTRGYRLAVPDWSRFRGDYDDDDDSLHGKHDRLLRILKSYFRARGLDTDWKQFEPLPTVTLLNALCTELPFGARDKQLLLEAVEPEQRLFTFISLLDSELQGEDKVTRH